MNAADKQFDELPPHARTVGMWLLLAALTMLFVAAMVGYVIIRLTSASRTVPITMPWTFAASTLAILAAGVTLHRGLHHARVNHPKKALASLQYTLLITLVFIGVQTPGMLGLLATHQVSPETGTTLYGLVFVLVLLHALHVLGGLVALIITILRLDDMTCTERDVAALKSLVMYWHFLDIVWIVMLLTFVIVR